MCHPPRPGHGDLDLYLEDAAVVVEVDPVDLVDVDHVGLVKVVVDSLGLGDELVEDIKLSLTSVLIGIL